MNKSDPPTSFGIFKSIGHTLIAFGEESQLQQAVASQASIGFCLKAWFAMRPMHPVSASH